MRVLSVVTTLNPRSGGPAEALRNLVPEFGRRGHVHHIVTCDDESEVFEFSKMQKVFQLGPPLRKFAYAPRLKPWLLEHMGEYDVVMVHGLWQYCGVAVWQASKVTKTPFWVLPHGMLDPYFNRISRVKQLKKQLYWGLQRRILRDAVSVLFTAEEEKLLARKSFRNYKVRESVISYAAAKPVGDPQEQSRSFYSKFPALEGRNYLLFLGRLHPKKGCDMLIRAFARTKNLHLGMKLVMAGPFDANYKSLLDRIASEENITDDIIWTDMLHGGEKYGAIRGADAFILPSHQENFGIAVAESLSCGIPTLISQAVNIWREIEEDNAGVVAKDTLEGTIELIERWCSLSEEQKLQMSQNARTCFKNRFTIEKCVWSLLQNFQPIVNKNKQKSLKQ